VILGRFEVSFSANDSLKGLYIISMLANGLGGVGTLFFTTGDKSEGKPVSDSTTDQSESEGNSASDLRRCLGIGPHILVLAHQLDPSFDFDALIRAAHLWERGRLCRN